eukprot:1298559-Pyramimonas_sp.AAC.1
MSRISDNWQLCRMSRAPRPFQSARPKNVRGPASGPAEARAAAAALTERHSAWRKSLPKIRTSFRRVGGYLDCRPGWAASPAKLAWRRTQPYAAANAARI